MNLLGQGSFMADGLEIIASVDQCTMASSWTGPVGGVKVATTLGSATEIMLMRQDC